MGSRTTGPSSSLHPVHLQESFRSLHARLREAVGGASPVLLTEKRLADVLAAAVEGLFEAFPGAPLVTFRGGETNKTRRTKEKIEDALFARGAGRDSVVIALGGGVVTDLVGFTASTYMRGIPWIALPTSLLGMVDAALGGKTAVNAPVGKNLIGAFHPPRLVAIALEVLDTLPRRQFLSGLAECLKHGIFLDVAHLEWLSSQDVDQLRKDKRLQRKLVQASVALKCRVVDEDPEEATGRRHVLNAGHTVGHALERLSGFRLSHGEAVASGLAWEAAAAAVQRYADREDAHRVLEAVRELGFADIWGRYPAEDVFAAAGADKKNRQGKPAYVPLGRIGSPALPPPHIAPLTEKALRVGQDLLKSWDQGRIRA